MNPKERFMAALACRQTDRVPAMEMICDLEVTRAMTDGGGFLDLVDKYDYFDLAVCTAGVVYPGKTNWVDKEKKIFLDKWGNKQQFTNQFMPHTIGGIVINSLEDAKKYNPPDPYDPAMIESVRETVRRFKDKKGLAILGEDVFAVCQYLLGGPEEMFVTMKLEPEIVHEVVKIAEKYHTELYKMAIGEGIEVVILGDDYASTISTLISPEDFEEFFYPGIKRIVSEIHKLGGKVIKHTDGNIWKILDLIVATGVDAVGPLQHEAGMELQMIKEKYPNLAVVGNIPVDILITGTPEDVRIAVLDLLDRMKAYNGHIISSGNSITSDVPPANLEMMMKTVLEYKRG